ncbi:MAG: hypothetical protein AAB790_01575, partial [Patescibacteria group bacterium]
VYLSNETATPSRDVKKKKKDAAIRPLLISASYMRPFGLSNIKEKSTVRQAGAFPHFDLTLY